MGIYPIFPAAEYERRRFRAGASADHLITSGLSGGRFDIPSTNITFLDDDSTSPNFDPNGHWNTSLSKWTVDANGTYLLGTGVESELVFTSKKNIQTIKNAGASTVDVIFASDHGLTSSGSTITIQGTVNYDGVYTATYINSTMLRITAVYVVDEFTGTVGVDVTGDDSYRIELFFTVLKKRLSILF